MEILNFLDMWNLYFQENEQASLFSGEEEVFAFDRTVSRLTEMQTEEYWKLRPFLSS